MKKAISFLICSILIAAVASMFIAPQVHVQHQGSSAFKMALNQAVDRLENGGRIILAGTATPVAAQVLPTYDGRYTCDTYNIPGTETCDAANPMCGISGAHTSDPMGHTCVVDAYTCQMSTCDTYDSQQFTCDANNADCTSAAGGHTTEPPPYNHTCDGNTCDGVFTCDFTVDPRAPTCDAANIDCVKTTIDYAMITCNPMRPECQVNNPEHCTAQTYPTCDNASPTCVFGAECHYTTKIYDTCDGISPTCDGQPGCTNPVQRTDWGRIKHNYRK